VEAVQVPLVDEVEHQRIGDGRVAREDADQIGVVPGLLGL
jgi:hypothetical protein